MKKKSVIALSIVLFAVTEVYMKRDGQWNLIQFSFTALTS